MCRLRYTIEIIHQPDNAETQIPKFLVGDNLQHTDASIKGNQHKGSMFPYAVLVTVANSTL